MLVPKYLSTMAATFTAVLSLPFPEVCPGERMKVIDFFMMMGL